MNNYLQELAAKGSQAYQQAIKERDQARRQAAENEDAYQSALALYMRCGDEKTKLEERERALRDAVAEYIDALTDPTGTEIEAGDVRSRTGRAWERLCILSMRSDVLFGPATPPQNP